MSAEDATSTGVPQSLPSTVTSQACTPEPAMADSRKKAKKSSIGRLISSARPVGPVASCRRGFGWSCRTRLWSRIAPTTGTPSSPTSSSAARQSMKASIRAMEGGASAKPRLPVKVWSAKARPMKPLSMLPARIA